VPIEITWRLDSLFLFFNETTSRFVYRPERKKYLAAEGAAPRLFGGAGDRAEMLRHRYLLLHQRTSRHDLFQVLFFFSPSSRLWCLMLFLAAQPSSAIGRSSGKYRLQPVEHLLGVSTRLSDLVVLGMLTYLKEGQLFLEDPTGSVPVSLKDTVRCCCLLENNLQVPKTFVSCFCFLRSTTTVCSPRIVSCWPRAGSRTAFSTWNTWACRRPSPPRWRCFLFLFFIPFFS